jgi:putative nucleotidyltransferase with HDIG domain
MHQKLAKNVALRFAMAKQLHEYEIRVDTFEEQLLELVKGIDDLEQVGKALGVDLKNLVRDLDAAVHTDDDHHNGETVLQHIRWVLEDVERLTDGWDRRERNLLRLVALFHDVGKAYTHDYDPERKKHTFYGHAEKSVELTKAILGRFEKDSKDFLQDLLDLVRLHDAFFMLLNNRKGQADRSSLVYLKKFMRESLAAKDKIQRLVTFAKADSARARTIQRTLEGIGLVLGEMEEWRERQAQKEREKEEAERRSLINLTRFRDKIDQIIEDAVPGASKLMPDIPAVFQRLQKAKRYDALLAIKEVLEK